MEVRLNINVRLEPIPFDAPPNIIIVFYVYEFDKVKCDRFAGRVRLSLACLDKKPYEDRGYFDLVNAYFILYWLMIENMLNHGHSSLFRYS